MFGWLFKKEEKKPIDKQSILAGNRVLGKFLEVWPDLNPGKLYLADKFYVMPTKEGLKKILFDSQIERYEYKSELQDCDDYALLLHAYVIRKRYKDFKDGKIPKEEQYSLAFGQVWYQDKRMGNHARNVCITDDKGVFLIEPQTDEIQRPDRNTFINFIRL